METNQNQPKIQKGSPIFALSLAFTPAAIFIAALGGLGLNLSAHQQNVFLWSACAVSIVCCFISSALLLQRGTGAAIAGAFLLFLLNGFIAFFFGCLASFKI